MRNRRTRWVVVGCTVVALVVAGVLTWRQLNRPEDAARAVAVRIAQGLARGELASGAFGATATPQDATELKAILLGMGALRPSVTLGPLAVTPDGRTATAHVSFSWTIHSGKAPWTYDSFLTLRLGDQGWYGVWDRTLLCPQLAPGLRLRAVRLAPERGEIVGARDERLVWNQPVNLVGIDKLRVLGDAARVSARSLAVLLGLPADAYVAKVANAGPKAFVQAGILRSDQDPDRSLGRRAAAIPGVHLIPAVRSRPQTPGFAAPILGSVGEATAEIIAASAGTIRAGDQVGLSGLQASRNADLMGVTGFRVVAYPSADPTTQTELFRVDPKPGTSQRVSLDARLQNSAERILANVGPASALVAIRPSDGALLAAASGPGGKGFSTATRGQYAPGSVFKTVSALAALRTGLRAGDEVICTPAITVDGKRFDNYDGYPSAALGRVRFTTAFANSCNTAMIRLRDRVAQPGLVSAAASLGLGPTPPLGVAAFLGTVPAQASDVEHAASMIGQGRVLVSPLGMATVAASIAAGRTVVPHLLEDGAATATATPAAGGLTDAEAATLRDLMAAVTRQGSGRLLADVPGQPVLSKTGTASYGKVVRFHAWMIAIQGDLAVAAFVDDGITGAKTAGPLLRRFLVTAR